MKYEADQAKWFTLHWTGALGEAQNQNSLSKNWPLHLHADVSTINMIEEMRIQNTGYRIPINSVKSYNRYLYTYCIHLDKKERSKTKKAIQTTKIAINGLQTAINGWTAEDFDKVKTRGIIRVQGAVEQ